MKKVEIDYSEIDEGMRDLIYNLNQLPFLATFYSCEGHLLDRWPNQNAKFGFKHSVELLVPKSTPSPVKNKDKIPIIFPDSGYKFIESGYLLFNLEIEEPRARLFLHDLLGLECDHPFLISTRRLRAVYVGYDPKGNRELFLNAFDLTPVKVDFIGSLEGLSLEEKVKATHHVKPEEGEKRILEFKKVWRDLLSIAKGYLE